MANASINGRPPCFSGGGSEIEVVVSPMEGLGRNRPIMPSASLVIVFIAIPPFISEVTSELDPSESLSINSRIFLVLTVSSLAT
jgi:hypothetical protein